MQEDYTYLSYLVGDRECSILKKKGYLVFWKLLKTSIYFRFNFPFMFWS